MTSLSVLKALSQAVDFRVTGNDKCGYSDREFDKFLASGHVGSARRKIESQNLKSHSSINIIFFSTMICLFFEIIYIQGGLLIE